MSLPNKKSIENYPFSIKIPINWGDMDAARHVNNIVYLRWAETARVHFLNELKINATFRENSIGPILAWQECKYIAPMTFPDTVQIGVRCNSFNSHYFIMESFLFSTKDKRAVAISNHKIVPYDYQVLKKVSLPREWALKLEESQQK